MNIVIVGGGTSGLVTAAIMQNFWKDKVNISLYYNPDNQSIGVGEGTTPSFIDVLNETLGYSTEDAIRELDATIKLGVLFKDWIPNTQYYHGFVEVANDETDKRSDKLSSNVSSFYSLINDCYKGGINFNEPTNTIPTELYKCDFAFHITTNKLCDFLFKYLKGRVNVIEDKVSEVNTDGKNIQSIICEKSGEVSADLFVDATGLDAMLLNKLDGAEWVDLSHHLPLDRAIPQKIKNHSDFIPSYTLANATKHGWIWQIPSQTEYGTGYLYSSKFTTDDEAKHDFDNWLAINHSERLDKEPRIIKWNSGYQKKAWIGNCVAVGLSGGFIEPLEALTHQYLTFMVETFMSLNSTLKMLDYNRDRFNMVQSRILFDYTQFLNLHYCTNRTDSKFWRHMKNNKTDWVRTLEEKCKHEFLDVFDTDDMLDYWGNDNYIQVMKGTNLFNKDAIQDYMQSRKNPELLYDDARQQHDYIMDYKSKTIMVDHKDYLETIKKVSHLPYLV